MPLFFLFRLGNASHLKSRVAARAPASKHRRAFARWLACSVVLVSWFASQLATGTQVKEVRRVLIIYETNSYSPLPNLIDPAIRTTLANSSYRIEFYREYLETASFPGPSAQRSFRDFYAHMYENRKLDVIITVGPAALEFMVEAHQKYFPGVPIIFCLPNRLPGGFTVDSNFTGIEGDIAPAATLVAALRLRPATKHVVVVSGTTPFDKQQTAAVKDQLKGYESRLNISYLTDLTMSALLERLKRLPSDSIVILGALGRDATGQWFTSDESGPLVVAAASVPVFCLNDRSLHHGEVGGSVSSATQQARIAGGMALRIINGEKPQNIPSVKDTTVYMFDWLALERWGMRERDLPPGSIIFNRPPTAWESYKPQIIAGTSLMIAQTLLILALLWQTARRREAESQLLRSLEQLQESEGRFRLVANTAPVMIWMSGPDKSCNYFNQRWLDFRGRSLAQELGQGWVDGIYQEDLERRLLACNESFTRKQSFKLYYRLKRHDGEYRWVLDIGVPRLHPDGSLAGYIGSCSDVTDQKEAEKALAEMGHRLIEAQEQERIWIARELHDDINQQIALVSVELEGVDQHICELDGQVHEQIRQARDRLFDIANDIHGLSHRLHSSKLELLGVSAAARSFCKEFSQQQNVEVEFVSKGVPQHLSKETSLCLFRVLQEAVQNAAKHSGAQHFTVELTGTDTQILLTVRDPGLGFSAKNLSNHRGLGLISMRERVHLVNGEFSIRSQPGGGTTVEAKVPFSVPEPAWND